MDRFSSVEVFVSSSGYGNRRRFRFLVRRCATVSIFLSAFGTGVAMAADLAAAAYRTHNNCHGRFSGLGRFRHLGAACLLRTGRKKGIGADASGVQEVHGSRFVMRLSRHFSLTLEKLYGT